ncbi:MAG TPA: hypothetical protein VK619_01080, partial [Pyrinomonadaceae bacterium]|nr:hypothetical protein [Pyrinomonadaceae bacterium]
MKKGSRLKFVPGFVRSIALDESVRAAWFPFLLTRAIFLIALLLVSNLTLLEPSFGGGVQEPEITLQSAGE